MKIQSTKQDITIEDVLFMYQHIGLSYTHDNGVIYFNYDLFE